MVDLNRFSDADLLALYAGDLDKMSNAGLMLLAGHEPKQSTVIGEAKRGTEQLLSSSLAGIKGIFYPEEAAQEELKRQESIAEKYGEGPSFEKLKNVYEREGLWPAAKELAGQVPKAIAQQIPQIGALAGGARLGAMAGALTPFPGGAVIGGALGAGASMLPQFFGQDIATQAQEQLAQGQPVDINRGSAAAAAALPRPILAR